MSAAPARSSGSWTNLARALICLKSLNHSEGIKHAPNNAMAESISAALECELLHRHRFRTRTEARVAVLAYYREGFLNPGQRRSALGQLSAGGFEGSHQPKYPAAQP